MSDVAVAPPTSSHKRRDAATRARRVAKRLSPKDIARVRLMRKNGIKRPTRVLLAAHATKLPVEVACALLVQEGIADDDLRRQDLLERFQSVSALIGFNGERKGLAAYRGEGSPAERFAEAVQETAGRWRGLLAVADEAPRKKLNPRDWWKQHVLGDTGCNRELLCGLANVAKDLKITIYVRSGNRTYDEQAALYRKYGPGRAARPGTSNHEGGRAADCAVGTNRDGRDLGEHPGAREALRRRGLCLPVNKEDWHVERGSTWGNN